MNYYPAVTIMIPAYNQANFLPLALESAMVQDYKNLEIVVSDDCSTDNTGEIIKTYMRDARLKYFRNEINLGRVSNYKRSLENYAQGDWVVNLDADDYFTDSSFISKAIKHILDTGQDQIVFLQAGHSVKTPEGRTIRLDVPVIQKQVEVVAGTEYFLNFNHFSHLATVFNRKLAIGLDFYRYNILSSDIESFLRLALHGQVILMRESVGVWVHHGANESQRLSIPVVEMNMLRIESPYIYAKSLNLFPGDTLLKWKNNMTNAYLQNYLIKSLKNKNVLDGYLRHILKYYPQVILSFIIPKAVLQALVSKISHLLGIRK